MSRGGGRGGGGGGGGGRGGRGGRRGGGPGQTHLSWDTDDPDVRPSELFPKYDIPSAAPLAAYEQREVNHFLLIRRQVHDGPLYTRKRSWGMDPTNPKKLYGQEQVNKKYGVRNRATVDPFTAVQTYSQRFDREEKALPEFGTTLLCKEFFPKELHATIAGDDLPPGQLKAHRNAKRRKLAKGAALPTSDDISHTNGEVEAEAAQPRAIKRTLELLAKLSDEEAEEEGEEVYDPEEGGGEDEDHEYDDSDAGDYDAEVYFENGDDVDDDGGDDENAAREGSY